MIGKNLSVCDDTPRQQLNMPPHDMVPAGTTFRCLELQLAASALQCIRSPTAASNTKQPCMNRLNVHRNINHK